ncbi:DgyrCDS8899 [Dimorphilus gyrociliatus]|uniref:Coronin n=1 Tax=Dimorphilus gyrociliatus TaxID=2664684 RepID=A0A7I8VVR6_9ANNE|nr:DgyrCDS8899 [Dimorphilus gyrociliatus]
MAWRNVSKFKNSAPKIPKKDQWITDVNSANLLNCAGNHIQCSAKYIAYNTSSGGSLGVVSLKHTGKVERTTHEILAHSEFVTDFDFSPFDDCLLATSSTDCTAKLWKLPQEDFTESISNPHKQLCALSKRIERILWHPCASDIIATASAHSVSVYDVEANKCFFEFNEHTDQVQSISWKGDGSLLVSSCKDRKIRIIDPRKNCLANSTNGHAGIRDSRSLWCGDGNYTISTGFSEKRSREVNIYDIRKFNSPLITREAGNNNGILIPLYDPDTNMLFLAGKGDTMISFMETQEKDPFLTEASIDSVQQFKGAALAPKKSMNVMSGEVNRVLLLASHNIIPVPYIVPRKSYYDFHADIFPDTNCSVPSMTSTSWMSGAIVPLSKISLDPTKKNQQMPEPPTKTVEEVDKNSHSKLQKTQSVEEVKLRHVDPLRREKPNSESNGSSSPFNVKLRHSVAVTDKGSNVEQLEPSFAQIKLKNVKKPVGMEAEAPEKSEERAAEKTAEVEIKNDVTPVVKKPGGAKFQTQRISKFKHLQGKPLHKNYHIVNLQNLSKTIPGESDGFSVNRKRCALPLNGPGGCVAVLELSKYGKLPVTGLPVLHNGSNVTDLAFDPFNECRIAIGTEESTINIWTIPTEGLEETLKEPQFSLRDHSDKIYFIKFHPLAKDVLASGSFDFTVKIWNLDKKSCSHTLNGHTDVIFNLSWHPNGSECVTLCKDSKIRVYEPRKSVDPVKQASAIIENSRGGRIQYVCGGDKLAVSNFTRQQTRNISIFDAVNLQGVSLACEEIDVSPATLMMLYDEDSRTIFATGRGDGTIFAFEAINEAPYLSRLSDIKGDGAHQGFGLLPKTECNVKAVEFARILRLTRSTIEPIPITVPRRKMEYFQDDIFPPTKALWEPSMTPDEWEQGGNKPLRTIDLKPTDMDNLSDHPDKPRASKYKFESEVKTKTDAEKRDELLESFSSKVNTDRGLEQDGMEGVEDQEWARISVFQNFNTTNLKLSLKQ